MTMNDSWLFVVDWSEHLPSCCGWRFFMDGLASLSIEKDQVIWDRYGLRSGIGAGSVAFYKARDDTL